MKNLPCTIHVLLLRPSGKVYFRAFDFLSVLPSFCHYRSGVECFLFHQLKGQTGQLTGWCTSSSGEGGGMLVHQVGMPFLQRNPDVPARAVPAAAPSRTRS